VQGQAAPAGVLSLSRVRQARQVGKRREMRKESRIEKGGHQWLDCYIKARLSIWGLTSSVN